MFDQSYGLRFDIYERIILSEDLPGIDELEEVELIPHIQVISQEEQATLRGHLLLAGLYRGDTEAGESEPLEHWIPVEITVPMNRVSSLDDIAVEIENFDVDLLSTRSLNITGVLSLKGIQAAVQGLNDGAWNNEEITVVHAPDSSAGDGLGYDTAVRQHETIQSEDPSPFYFPQVQEVYAQDEQVTGFDLNAQTSGRDEEFQSEQHQEGSGFGNQGSVNLYTADGATGQELHREQPSQKFAPSQPAEPPFANSSIQSAQSISESNPNVWNFERADQSENSDQSPSSGFSEITDDREQDSMPVLASSDQEVDESSEDKEDSVVASVQEAVFLADESPVQEEPPAKPELKVAFTSKNSTVGSSSGVGFSSLLQSSRTVQEQEITAREEDEKAEEYAEPLASEDVQWKSLFLGKRQEDTPFRKVRLCIVQREETLEAIAERYQLSPRELLLYNRLSEQSVEEGQVLYIP
ncbi:LysM peptidoglycan-binding domain-containing protein [Paenibacillus sp. N3/727]|uniref:LysM peptidoglycan-binding domain-containing protein n=1 Tax=Paenibacillus sp. N3/727 TaxID=2925845 RepID=UPI001F52E9D9|nr:LysM peptidoglycan-binding domain-containing protein [Paenibacillus sp. N3/727]UNK19832.1 LysM peptidoglycan-binding domain-containing protein [Paenibacillus sp. N3/727]